MPSARTCGYVLEDDCREVLLLSGDQFYRMDFRELILDHRAVGADLTVAVLPVDRTHAQNFGIVRVDGRQRISDLVEKPQQPQQLDAVRTPAAWLAQQGYVPSGRDYLANMGIYLFKRDTLLGLLRAHPLAVDLVTEVLMPSLKTAHIRAHLFRGYWEDVGSIASYHPRQPGAGQRSGALRLLCRRGRHLHAHARPARLAHQCGPAGGMPHQRRLRGPSGGVPAALCRGRAQRDRAATSRCARW